MSKVLINSMVQAAFKTVIITTVSLVKLLPFKRRFKNRFIAIIPKLSLKLATFCFGLKEIVSHNSSAGIILSLHRQQEFLLVFLIQNSHLPANKQKITITINLMILITKISPNPPPTGSFYLIRTTI